MAILIGIIFILPVLRSQLGLNLNIVSQAVIRSTDINAILLLTGNT